MMKGYKKIVIIMVSIFQISLFGAASAAGFMEGEDPELAFAMALSREQQKEDDARRKAPRDDQAAAAAVPDDESTMSEDEQLAFAMELSMQQAKEEQLEEDAQLAQALRLSEEEYDAAAFAESVQQRRQDTQKSIPTLEEIESVIPLMNKGNSRQLMQEYFDYMKSGGEPLSFLDWQVNVKQPAIEERIRFLETQKQAQQQSGGASAAAAAAPVFAPLVSPVKSKKSILKGESRVQEREKAQQYEQEIDRLIKKAQSELKRGNIALAKELKDQIEQMRHYTQQVGKKLKRVEMKDDEFQQYGMEEEPEADIETYEYDDRGRLILKTIKGEELNELLRQARKRSTRLTDVERKELERKESEEEKLVREIIDKKRYEQSADARLNEGKKLIKILDSVVAEPGKATHEEKMNFLCQYLLWSDENMTLFIDKDDAVELGISRKNALKKIIKKRVEKILKSVMKGHLQEELKMFLVIASLKDRTINPDDPETSLIRLLTHEEVLPGRKEGSEKIRGVIAEVLNVSVLGLAPKAQ